jgi:PAS domain S-box-containing protein
VTPARPPKDHQPESPERQAGPSAAGKDGPAPTARQSATVPWDHIILGLKRTTKEFVENVLENIIESIIVTDLAGRLVLFNKYSQEMFGYTAEEVLGRHIAVLGALRPDVIGHIRRNKPYNGEVILRRKDGTRFPAHVRNVPLRDEEGKPVAMVGVATDLTRKKEEERTAREVARLKAFNENIIASLNDGILIIDLTGRITFANQRMAEMLGYTAGTLEWCHYSELVPLSGRTLFRDLISRGGEDNSRTTFEVSWLTCDGKKLPTLVSTSWLRDPSGPQGVIAAVTDFSEVKSLKEELFQSEKMSLVGTLASEVAHEINNPLGGLIVAVQMMIKDLEADVFDRESFMQELRDVEHDAKRCRDITRQLLDFSRPISGERSLLGLNQAIEDGLILVQRQAELDNVVFIKDYAEDLPRILANTNSLQQVVINLVKNACDAMSQGGEVTIRTGRFDDEKGAWVRALIEDTGPGIPPAIAQNIFNPFLTTKGKGRGTGLGLPVSKRIVEEFGGHLTFWNKDTGGAVFQILFPAA